jgi:hypothetical protein
MAVKSFIVQAPGPYRSNYGNLLSYLRLHDYIKWYVITSLSLRTGEETGASSTMRLTARGATATVTLM